MRPAGIFISYRIYVPPSLASVSLRSFFFVLALFLLIILTPSAAPRPTRVLHQHHLYC